MRVIRLVLSAEAGRGRPGKSGNSRLFVPPSPERHLPPGAQLADNADSMAEIDARLATPDRAGTPAT
jgi:hypothetical protein